MVKFQVDARVKGTPNVTTYTVEAPAVPQVETYISHDQLGFAGYVKDVDFWWDESGTLTITVVIEVAAV
jgi:hypothetical protein